MKSKGEESLARILTWAGYPFRREYEFHDVRRWRSDFYIPYTLLVEIEGVSYSGEGTRHQRGFAYEKDAEKYNEATLQGFDLLRFTPRMITGVFTYAGNARQGTVRAVQVHAPAIEIIDRYFFSVEQLGRLDRTKQGYASHRFPAHLFKDGCDGKARE